MIPILFESTVINFDNFGLGVLRDTTSCAVTEERNGAFEAVLKYPTGGRLYSEIKKERIVLLKTNDEADNQAFRIYKITVPINGIITIYAEHISYDLATIGVIPFSLENSSPQLAIDKLLKNTATKNNFTFQTDATLIRSFNVEEPKSVRNALGGSSGSLLDIWGGEFEWDNFKIKHHLKRGLDRGVIIRYGKNLTNLDYESDITDAYSYLLPYAVDDEDKVVTLPEAVLNVETTIIQNGKTYIKDFTDEFGKEEKVTEYALRTKAGVWLKKHPLGKETSSIKISFEDLSKYSNFRAIHERVSLCDAVTVIHEDLNVKERLKVISVEYDTLAEKYKSITLGEAKSNMAVTLNEIESHVNQTNKEVERIPKLLATAIDNATSLITGNKGGTVVLHTNSDSGEPYELLILDNEDINKAVNVWRWNLSGLGFSSHGYNGPYDTAITADGSIVANFITSGTLLANLIKAGTISSLDGSSYWNIETGDIVIKSYATVDSVEEIKEQKMYRLNRFIPQLVDRK